MQIFQRINHSLRLLFPLLLMIGVSTISSAQDISEIGHQIQSFDARDLKINGGLSFSNAFYWNDGIDPRRDPMQWRLQARLNFSLSGINAPFSLNFSDGNQQFNLPSYAFVGISPKYKWATLHLGDRNLNFSKYTLNGITFRGVGTELKPGKFNFSAMYGRLSRAVAEDLNNLQNLDPAYERWGWGFKTGITTAKYDYQVIYFSAWDDENSILTPVTADVLPSENKIISLLGRHKITKRLNLDLEVARSAFNRDKRAPLLAEAELGSAYTLYGLFQPNSSGSAGSAVNTGLGYYADGFSVRAGYERIDRGYRTLGAIFFNNDQDYSTLSFSKSFAQNKLTMFIKGGLERTNLDDDEQISTNRWIGSGNLNYSPTDKLSFSAAYSNFRNSTKLRSVSNVLAPVDSIFLAQLTRTASLSGTLLMGSKIRPATLSLMLSQQSANSVIDDVVQAESESDFFNGSLIYTQQIKERELQLITSLNLNNASFTNLRTVTLSPTIGIRKQYLNRQLSTDLRLTFNSIYIEGAHSNAVWNLSLGTDYRFLKDHSLGLSTSFIHRTARQAEHSAFSELYGRLLYGYRFSSHQK